MHLSLNRTSIQPSSFPAPPQTTLKYNKTQEQKENRKEKKKKKKKNFKKHL